jgi:hypothetical protein
LIAITSTSGTYSPPHATFNQAPTQILSNPTHYDPGHPVQQHLRDIQSAADALLRIADEHYQSIMKIKNKSQQIAFDLAPHNDSIRPLDPWNSIRIIEELQMIYEYLKQLNQSPATASHTQFIADTSAICIAASQIIRELTV